MFVVYYDCFTTILEVRNTIPQLRLDTLKELQFSTANYPNYSKEHLFE